MIIWMNFSHARQWVWCNHFGNYRQLRFFLTIRCATSSAVFGRASMFLYQFQSAVEIASTFVSRAIFGLKKTILIKFSKLSNAMTRNIQEKSPCQRWKTHPLLNTDAWSSVTLHRWPSTSPSSTARVPLKRPPVTNTSIFSRIHSCYSSDAPKYGETSSENLHIANCWERNFASDWTRESNADTFASSLSDRV